MEAKESCLPGAETTDSHKCGSLGGEEPRCLQEEAPSERLRGGHTSCLQRLVCFISFSSSCYRISSFALCWSLGGDSYSFFPREMHESVGLCVHSSASAPAVSL